MKRVIVLLSGAVLLSACSVFHWGSKNQVASGAPVKSTKATLGSDGRMQVGLDGVPIERIPFVAGVSTATVERMAKQHACTGGVGAGLITEAGPVEVYRMVCDDGKVFMARCELRQCKPMQ